MDRAVDHMEPVLCMITADRMGMRKFMGMADPNGKSLCVSLLQCQRQSGPLVDVIIIIYPCRSLQLELVASVADSDSFQLPRLVYPRRIGDPVGKVGRAALRRYIMILVSVNTRIRIHHTPTWDTLQKELKSIHILAT